mgnify:CR=1 FL=1
MRYKTITLFLWRFPHFEPVCTVRRRTLHAAERAAEKLLARHEVETTWGCYWRDVKRAPFALINDKRGLVDQIDAPVRIVPSVGELGVTP